MRPFVLTRSAFAGVQRYSAVWSGDNQANDTHLMMGELINEQMGLSGVPFVGPDLGGYIGDGNKELYKRWIEVGVFSPFVRNHREYFGAANEPWAYGEEAEAISKSYIGFRYRLLPYLYSKFYEATQTGMPISRSLCINYPFEDKVYDPLYQYQFLFGDALLVAPVSSQDRFKKVWLPRGTWYDLFTNQVVEGDRELVLEMAAYKIPLYVKSSSIIPMQNLVQSTKEVPSDTLYIHIFNGGETNRFIWYEDDGSSMDYKKQMYSKRVIEFNPVSKKITIEGQEGKYTSHFHYLNIFLHGFGEKQMNIRSDGRLLQTSTAPGILLDPLDELEDYYDKDSMKLLRMADKKSGTQSVVLPNHSGTIEMNY
jgi:alpha-glucosidase